MLTDKQRRQIIEFCREHEIMQFWLVDFAFDEPLPDQYETGNLPTAIVSFRPGNVPDFFTFLDLEEELRETTGPGTSLYTDDGFNRREMAIARESAEFHYAEPA